MNVSTEQKHESFGSILNKVRGLDRKQLEDLLLVGNRIERSLAQSQLDLLEFRQNVKKEIAEMVEKTANEAFEEALSKVGYKLVGRIEKL